MLQLKSTNFSSVLFSSSTDKLSPSLASKSFALNGVIANLLSKKILSISKLASKSVFVDNPYSFSFGNLKLR